MQRIELSARRGRPIPLYNRYIKGDEDWSMDDENRSKSSVEDQDNDLFTEDYNEIAETMPF